ncbi:polygalacturonase-like [Salvia splendens]|uniref:polygalacturonase-like n=1 Tax=Salvia splendens TaxID=180675 RepID=UPI001C259D19|nr:polygalacturonase-like [Salvia splendens]
MPKLAVFSQTFFLVLNIATLLQICIAKSYNVVDFGARADGKTDSSSALLKAWVAACSSGSESTVLVPQGTFLVDSVSLYGPCKNKMQFQLLGNIVAPSYESLSNHQSWISFNNVDGLSFIGGGTIDAKGKLLSFSLQGCNNVLVNGLKSFDSEGVHISINECNNITMQNLILTAPADSPNTDGIHIGNSNFVSVLHSKIGTGDDCISIGPGTRNMWMDHIVCGPGHGISIGSIGGAPREEGVENIEVQNSVFTNTDNGVRIKTWARPSNATVTNVKFTNLVMKNVTNPIIIDQEYCPQSNCPKGVRT